MIKTNKFSTLFSLLFVAIFCFFCFAGCGETRSWKETSEVYHSILGEYRGIVFNSNNNVEITYDETTTFKINSSSSNDLYYNLRNESGNNLAVFIPALQENLTVMEYFIGWNVEKYKDVPSEKMNELYSEAKNLKNTLYDFKRIRSSLISASNKDNWIVEYREIFYKTISSFNEFTLNFLNVFENYVIEDTSTDGRISVTKTQLEFAKKLAETSYFLTNYCIKDNISTSFNQNSVFANDFLSIYNLAKDVFSGDKFQNILNKSRTEQEQKMISALEKIENYNSFYYSQTSIVKSILKTDSLKELQEKKTKNTITDGEQVELNKLNEFEHTYSVMKGYFVELKDALIDFNNN